MRAFPTLSAFERRASARLLRRPRTGELATSAITRVPAEKATRRNGSVWLYEGAAQAMMSACRHAHPVHRVVRAVEGALRLPLMAPLRPVDGR
jgi:hypothetical protein